MEYLPCSTCKRSLPPEAFNINRTLVRGRSRYCKDCYAVKHNAYRRRRLARDPEFRAKLHAYERTYYRRHPQKVRARRRLKYLVRMGQMPKASTLTCLDCGAAAVQYDHWRGYADAAALDVQPVYVKCHGMRARVRGEMVKTAP